MTAALDHAILDIQNAVENIERAVIVSAEKPELTARLVQHAG